MTNLERLTSMAREHLGPELAEAWLGSLRPAVRLVPAAEGDPVVAVVGGPSPYAAPEDDHGHLATLDCAALTALVPDLPLPATGHVVCFLENLDEDDAYVDMPYGSVVHVTDAGGDPRTPAWPGPDAPDWASGSGAAPCPMTGVPTWTWPDPHAEADLAATAGDLADELRSAMTDSGLGDALDDLREAEVEGERHHRVGGWATFIQGGPEVDGGWTCVLQLDHDPRTCFAEDDGGRAYFLAGPQDSAAGRFDDVVVEYDSY